MALIVLNILLSYVPLYLFLLFPPQGQDSPSAVHVIFNYLINVQSCIPVNTMFIVVITLFC